VMAWGVVFAVVGLALTVTGIIGSRYLARVSLVGSACLSMAWAAGLMIGVITGPTGPLLIFGLLSLAAKDLVMVANPFLVPFE
jgi:hypothetical protein